MADAVQPASAPSVQASDAIEQYDVIIIGAGVTRAVCTVPAAQLGFTARSFEDAAASGELGIGTAIRGRDSTRRATPTATPFRRSCCRNGTGKNFIPANRRTSVT